MKILLIDPPGWQKGGVNLGLLYLAAMALEHNHDINILDLNNYFYNLEEIVGNFQPDFIGHSIRTATVKSAEKVSMQLKEKFPKLTQIAGGPHITLCFKEFFAENPQIDFGFLGESEGSFVKFINTLDKEKKDFNEISGLVYRENGEILWNNPVINNELDNLPFPKLETVINVDYSLFPYPLLTSRGCPYGCIFCCVNLVSSRKWRARSVESIIEELKFAKQKYGFKNFEILDDNFTLNMGRAKKVCHQIIKEKLNLTWYCHNGIRADKLDLELVQLMKEAGCESCAIGIETGNPEVFRSINKGENLKDIVRAVELMKKVKMKTVGYFIIGLPGDNLEGVKKTIEFQNSLNLDDFMYNIAISYPGTKFWEYVQNNGRFLMDVRDLQHFSDDIKIPFETTDFTGSERKEAYQIAMNQTDFASDKLKNFLNSKKKKNINSILLIGFDGVSYRIIRKAYPNAELTVFSNRKLIYEAKFLVKEDKRITFIDESIIKGISNLNKKRGNQKFDFALLTLRGLLSLNKTIVLMFNPIDLIIIHRSSESKFKPFRHLVPFKKSFLLFFLLFNLLVWVISQIIFLITVAFTNIRRFKR